MLVNYGVAKVNLTAISNFIDDLEAEKFEQEKLEAEKLEAEKLEAEGEWEKSTTSTKRLGSPSLGSHRQ